jgi:hypothetical protein
MMNKSNPSSVTVEEAVARMVNMDYIPEGFTLSDMTSGFQEEAEVEYENARIDCQPKEKLAPLEARMFACKARHTLALTLLERLKHELDNIDDSLIILADDTSMKTRLTLESVELWAAYEYGIGIPEWSHADHDKAMPKVSDETEQATGSENDTSSLTRFNCWEEVTIRIYANDKLAHSVEKGKYETTSFDDVGLMDRRKSTPNHQGGILIGLSVGRKFPTGSTPAGKDKTAISKLRGSLARMTGIADDPFCPFNAGDGWKPRFTIVDNRKNADTRAKKAATHVSYDDTINYDIEDDQAGKWLDSGS